MKSMNDRQRKVAHEVQQHAAMALLQGRVHSTLPLSRLTVVTCWVSADLRLARLYLDVPSELDTPETYARATAELAKPLRHYLASHLHLKNVPALSFHPREV
ncbi:MAG: ribosome-binding factor A [Alphaproteobacteria bacterium]|nr:ribosome-binding factor A [Alphaproteobacteria bacterium]